jgi:hypothetical protein
MSFIDADVALRGSFAPGSNESSRFRRYEGKGGGQNEVSTSEQRDASPSRRDTPLPLNLGIGWVEVLRPRLRAHVAQTESAAIPAPGQHQSNFDTQSPHDLSPHDLAPMRGIMLGMAMGGALWALLGGLVGILFLL